MTTERFSQVLMKRLPCDELLRQIGRSLRASVDETDARKQDEVISPSVTITDARNEIVIAIVLITRSTPIHQMVAQSLCCFPCVRLGKINVTINAERRRFRRVQGVPKTRRTTGFWNFEIRDEFLSN